MADDKTKRGSPDSKRLNKSEPYEVAYAKRKAAKKAGASKTASKKAGAAKKSSAKSGAARSPASGARKPQGTSASPARKRAATAPSRSGPKPKVRATPKPPKEEKTAENTAPKTLKEADAVDLLTDDHLDVSVLFKQYEKLAKKDAPAAQRQPLAEKICAMLKAHTTIEEEIFYPAARRAGLEADQMDEADIEHASAKDLMAQIAAGNPDDDHYDAKVKVLGEYITHHVVEEHTEMFTKCRRLKMDLVALRQAMSARKAELLPDSMPGEGEPKGGLLSRIGETLFSKS